MPLYPAVDPSPSDFPRQPDLETLPDEQPIGGLAPWRKVAIHQDPLLLHSETDRDFDRDASPLVFGCGVFGQNMYNTSQTLASDVPIRSVRLALRYGINAFDTSPYYFPSEFILGNILKQLEPEFPRSSYFIITKCGRHGPEGQHFDYSPEKVATSIKASCGRIGTDYLDVALMHDAEFVAEKVGTSHHDGWASGIVSGHIKPTSVTREETLGSLGLKSCLEAASNVHGPGDEKMLDAVRTLFALKDQGVIKRLGISGYPLAVLLRVSRLVATNPPYRPLDVILSYSNHCLHSDALTGWSELFATDPRGDSADKLCELTWKPPILINGSPFSMGLLTDGNPPLWHPASAELKQACKDASKSLMDKGDSLAFTALGYGIRGSEINRSKDDSTDGPRPQLRTLVGLSTNDQVHSAIQAYRMLCARDARPNEELLYPLSAGERPAAFEAYKKQVENEDEVRTLFAERQVREWSWSSGL